MLVAETYKSTGKMSMATRPSFSAMRHQFSVIFGSGDIGWVGEKIGGKVGDNIELGKRDPLAGFTNACAIRMSYSLNYSGSPVVRGAWATVSGADKRWYLFRVRDLLPYLTKSFGKPDKTVKNPKESDFAKMQGILVFSVPFRDATGHATLWDGRTCSDHCYFPRATEASIWLLK